jgi:hypothetical protein
MRSLFVSHPSSQVAAALLPVGFCCRSLRPAIGVEAFALRGFRGAFFRNRTALAAENPCLRKWVALFQGREKESKRTTPTDRFVLSSWLASSIGAAQCHCKASYVDLLVSDCVPAILALEVETGWTTTSPSRVQAASPTHSRR